MDHATVVENTIKRFYSSGDNEAHTWLLQVQASKEAWTFVWQLLDPSKSSEVQFFAADTLYTKISKYWDEVPKSEYLDLRVRIFEILKHPGTSTFALSRLCQALAVFIINYSMSQDENKEKCMVEELMEALPYNSQVTVGLLLRVLEAMPKEVNINNLITDSTKKLLFPHFVELLYETDQGYELAGESEPRNANRESMLYNWYKTVWILQQIFSSCAQVNDSESNALFLLGVECTLSWLKLGKIPLDTIGPIYPHLLIAAARFIPSRDLEHESSRSWEVVQECVTMVITHGDLYYRPILFWEWGKSLMCMAKEYEPRHYYEILTAFGEAHSRSLLLALTIEDPNLETQKWTAQQLIEFLLECSEQEGRYPIDERRSCIPFGFWYALQGDLETLDDPLERQAALVLKPIYARLAQALLRKSTLPASPEEAGNAEERELFRCYRQDVADTLIYCYNVLRQDLLILLGQRLTQYYDVSKWTEVESTIHAFRAISDCQDKKAEDYVTAIMSLLLSHVPYAMYPRDVLCSACTAMGDYAWWIDNHPEYLERTLRLVLLGLTEDPLTAQAASMALKDIVRDCDQHLGPLAPSLLETISRTLPRVSADEAESLRLMYVASKLLKALPTAEEQMRHLETTFGLCLVRLRELLQRPVSESEAAVSCQLKMITIPLYDECPVSQAILEALLPIFKGIVNHPEWSRNDMTLEAMFNCAQKASFALKDARQETSHELKVLIEVLRTSYRIRPHPAALNYLKMLVLMYGRHPDNIIVPVLVEVSEITLRGVASCQQAGGDLLDLDELLEAYLNLLANVCKKNARLLLQIADQVPEMLRCGISCFLLPEISISKAAGSFLTHAILQSPHLKTFIEPIGQQLICVIVQYIEDFAKSRNLEPLAEVLLAMNKVCLCHDQMKQWFYFALADCPVNEKTKENFVQGVLRERFSKQRMCDKLRDFSVHYWQVKKISNVLTTEARNKCAQDLGKVLENKMIL